MIYVSILLKIIRSAILMKFRETMTFSFLYDDMLYVSIFLKIKQRHVREYGSLVTTTAYNFLNTWDVLAHAHNPVMDLRSSLIESH
jgi:hypothetical protein